MVVISHVGCSEFWGGSMFQEEFLCGVGVVCTICVSGSLLWITYFARAAHSQFCLSSTPVSH
eukprot:12224858-Ditylum_brightwellii.AAC.1